MVFSLFRYSGDSEHEYGQMGKIQKRSYYRQHATSMKSSVRHLLISLLCFQSSIALSGKMSRQDLRNWLSPPDPSTNHNTAHSAQHEGTATWFFDGGIYKEWKSNPSLLWIHGKRMSLSPSAILHPIDSYLHSRLWKERHLVRC